MTKISAERIAELAKLTDFELILKGLVGYDRPLPLIEGDKYTSAITMACLDANAEDRPAEAFATACLALVSPEYLDPDDTPYDPAIGDFFESELQTHKRGEWSFFLKLVETVYEIGFFAGVEFGARQKVVGWTNDPN